MKILVYIGFLVLGILAARGARWAYISFVVLGILYFPASVGFHLHPQPCEGLPNMALAVYSLGNYGHIVLFALFFIMTSAQFRMSNWQGFAWAALAAITMGVLVELAQGITGFHHCRSRDLIPDAAGILLGSIIVWLWNRLRTKPSPESPTGGEETPPNNSFNRSAS
jgi:VanZ family protein